jgi:hypothetical protein
VRLFPSGDGLGVGEFFRTKSPIPGLKVIKFNKK